MSSPFRRWLALAILVTTLAVACGTAVGPGEFNLEKLSGTWVIHDGAKTQIESWSLNDSGLIGRGLVMNNADTTFVEELAISKLNETWVYQAKVSGQNNDQPIQFLLENQTNQLIAFANYAHDFPQRIVYEFLSDNHLQVYIEGPRDGEKIRIVMDFKRQM
jgi:Domain of unknown function (DUF6265)